MAWAIAFGSLRQGTAENVAEQYGITREDQDSFAVQSQNVQLQLLKLVVLKKSFLLKSRNVKAIYCIWYRWVPKKDASVWDFRQYSKMNFCAGNASGINLIVLQQL